MGSTSHPATGATWSSPTPCRTCRRSRGGPRWAVGRNRGWPGDFGWVKRERVEGKRPRKTRWLRPDFLVPGKKQTRRKKRGREERNKESKKRGEVL